MRGILQPANWLARRLEGRDWMRRGLGNLGASNAEGRLELNYENAGEDPVQVVYRNRYTGNFECRAIIQNVKDGQTFGLFSADTRDLANYVELPPGTVDIEFSRKGTTFTAKVNGQEVEVESKEDTPDRMPGQLGISLPPGTQCTIAAFQAR